MFSVYMFGLQCSINEEDRCPPLPDSDNRQYNTTSVELGTVVRVSCDEGYLLNETEAITVTCDVSGEWDLDIPPCLRKYSLSPKDRWCISAPASCPKSTATTHIGSSCACRGVQSRFSLVLVTALGQPEAVQDSHKEPIMLLFHAVVTVTAKWLYSQTTAIYS